MPISVFLLSVKRPAIKNSSRPTAHFTIPVTVM